MPGLKLVAELGGDGSGYDAMMNRANKTKDRFASAFSGLKNVIAGAFTVGAITSLTRKTIEFGGHLRDVSDRLGINVEWLQETGFAAKMAGADVDKLVKFLEKIGQTRDIALQGGESGQRMRSAFAQFGISDAQLKSSSLQGLFDQIAKAYQDGSQQKLLPAIKEIAGRSGGDLVAAFVQGIDEARNLARESGIVMSEDTIDTLDAIGDEFENLQHLLVSGFAPAVLEAAEAVSKAAGLMKQSGAGVDGFLTGFLSKFDSRESGLKGFFQGIADGLEEGWKQTQRSVVSEANDQADREDAMANARRITKAARRTREREGASFTTFDAKAPRDRMVTDSLVGVGNFLGRNPSIVNNVASQQLRISQLHLAVAQQTLDATRLIGNRLAASTGGINVP